MVHQTTTKPARAQHLLDRLANDRYLVDQHSEGADDRCCRRAWNSAIDHAVELVERFLCEEADRTPIETGLRELVENTR